MLQTQMEVKKVYSFLNPSINSWDLTDDETIAKQDITYSLATIEDLHDMVAGCGFVFPGKVLTVDGVVQWHEETTEDEDYFCEYRIAN